MSSAKVDPTIDGWKKLADTLNSAAEALASSGLKPGYHNHQPEWVKMVTRFRWKFLRKYQAISHDAVGCGHLPGIRRRSGGLDQSESWTHSLDSLQDWSSDPSKGYKVYSGGQGGLERHLRSGRKRWWR